VPDNAISGVPSGTPDMALSGKNHVYFMTKQALSRGWNWKGCFEKPASDGSYLAVGFNRVGNPLEVAYRELDDGSLFVFHAMPCRQKWLAIAANEGGKHGKKTN